MSGSAARSAFDSALFVIMPGIGPAGIGGTVSCALALFSVKQMEAVMRKLALGVAAAAAMLIVSVPALAQVGFYAGPGGFGVGVGAPYYYDYYPYGYYDYYAGPRVVVRPDWRGHHWHHWHHHHWR
jgi:hypothetical protein